MTTTTPDLNSLASTVADLTAKVDDLRVHATDTSNPHKVTKTHVGLDKVANELQLSANNNLSDVLNADASRKNIKAASQVDLDSEVGSRISEVARLDKAIQDLNNEPEVELKALGLDKIINARQISTEKNEFAQFATKSSVQGKDKFLIEDSSSSFEKKTVEGSAISHKILSDVGKFTHEEIDAFLSNKNNPTGVTAAHVGLSEVSNVPQLDANKNLSDLKDLNKAKQTLGIGGLASQEANNVAITGGNISVTNLQASGGTLTNIFIDAKSVRTETLVVSGPITSTGVKIGKDTLLTNKQPGWGTPSGTLTRGNFAAYAGQDIKDKQIADLDAQVVSLSQTVAALISDLKAHGLI